MTALRNALLGTALLMLRAPASPSDRPEPDRPDLTVLVRDYAGLSAPVLREVEQQVGSALSRAGIHLNWIVCQGAQITPGVDECDSYGNLLLRILERYPKGWKRRGDPLGAAEIEGRYASIYAGEIHRISAAYDLSFSALLACAAAHEIGHLLLGREHDTATIMRGRWDRSTCRAISQRALDFDARQRAAMQQSVSARRNGGSETLVNCPSAAKPGGNP